MKEMVGKGVYVKLGDFFPRRRKFCLCGTQLHRHVQEESAPSFVDVPRSPLLNRWSCQTNQCAIGDDDMEKVQHCHGTHCRWERSTPKSLDIDILFVSP